MRQGEYDDGVCHILAKLRAIANAFLSVFRGALFAIGIKVPGGYKDGENRLYMVETRHVFAGLFGPYITASFQALEYI